MRRDGAEFTHKAQAGECSREGSSELSETLTAACDDGGKRRPLEAEKKPRREVWLNISKEVFADEIVQG